MKFWACCTTGALLMGGAARALAAAQPLYSNTTLPAFSSYPDASQAPAFDNASLESSISLKSSLPTSTLADPIDSNGGLETLVDVSYVDTSLAKSSPDTPTPALASPTLSTDPATPCVSVDPAQVSTKGCGVACPSALYAVAVTGNSCSSLYINFQKPLNYCLMCGAVFAAYASFIDAASLQKYADCGIQPSSYCTPSASLSTAKTTSEGLAGWIFRKNANLVSPEESLGLERTSAAPVGFSLSPVLHARAAAQPSVEPWGPCTTWAAAHVSTGSAAVLPSPTTTHLGTFSAMWLPSGVADELELATGVQALPIRLRQRAYTNMSLEASHGLDSATGDLAWEPSALASAEETVVQVTSTVTISCTLCKVTTVTAWGSTTYTLSTGTRTTTVTEPCASTYTVVATPVWSSGEVVAFSTTTLGAGFSTPGGYSWASSTGSAAEQRTAHEPCSACKTRTVVSTGVTTRVVASGTETLTVTEPCETTVVLVATPFTARGTSTGVSTVVLAVFSESGVESFESESFESPEPSFEPEKTPFESLSENVSKQPQRSILSTVSFGPSSSQGLPTSTAWEPELTAPSEPSATLSGATAKPALGTTEPLSSPGSSGHAGILFWSVATSTHVSETLGRPTETAPAGRSAGSVLGATHTPSSSSATPSGARGNSAGCRLCTTRTVTVAGLTTRTVVAGTRTSTVVGPCESTVTVVETPLSTSGSSTIFSTSTLSTSGATSADLDFWGEGLSEGNGGTSTEQMSFPGEPSSSSVLRESTFLYLSDSRDETGTAALTWDASGRSGSGYGAERTSSAGAGYSTFSGPEASSEKSSLVLLGSEVFSDMSTPRSGPKRTSDSATSLGTRLVAATATQVCSGCQTYTATSVGLTTRESADILVGSRVGTRSRGEAFWGESGAVEAESGGVGSISVSGGRSGSVGGGSPASVVAATTGSPASTRGVEGPERVGSRVGSGGEAVAATDSARESSGEGFGERTIGVSTPVTVGTTGVDETCMFCTSNQATASHSSESGGETCESGGEETSEAGPGAVSGAVLEQTNGCGGGRGRAVWVVALGAVLW